MNPQMLVLGGGLVKDLQKLVLTEIEKGLKEYLAPEVQKGLKIRAAQLGSAAAALGAANLVLEHWRARN
jgi:predicted NBD/HSP70 family sugar kinase